MGLTDDSFDRSVEGILAKGEICFMEDQRYTLKRETELELFAGLLVSRLMLALTFVVAIVGYATMGASVSRGITTALATHDGKNRDDESDSSHTEPCNYTSKHLDCSLQTRMTKCA